MIITYCGRRRAMLIPLPEDNPDGARNPAFGIWRDRTDDVGVQVRELRAARKLP